MYFFFCELYIQLLVGRLRQHLLCAVIFSLGTLDRADFYQSVDHPVNSFCISGFDFQCFGCKVLHRLIILQLGQILQQMIYCKQILDGIVLCCGKKPMFMRCLAVNRTAIQLYSPLVLINTRADINLRLRIGNMALKFLQVRNEIIVFIDPVTIGGM